MVISGLQKMTLLDYPGKVACTVFLQGCNFRCPFCHNSDLLGTEGPEPVAREILMAFLEKRRGLLDGVCITGGEPTLQPALPDLLADIKALGYATKLDTNGFRPDVLKHLVREGLVDYVAMDLKNCPDRYAETVGVPGIALGKIEESVIFLLGGDLDFEFRTTVAQPLHDVASVERMGQWLAQLSDRKAPRFFLQRYVDRDGVLVSGLTAPGKEEMEAMAEAIAPYVQTVALRGVE